MKTDRLPLTLGDHCNFINGGSWTANEYDEIGYPVLKVSNFDLNGIDHSNLSFLRTESFPQYQKHALQKNDVVIATVGSHPSLVNSAAGRSLIIPESANGYLLNQNAVCLRTKDENVIDQKFLGRLCTSQLFQHFIQQRGKGAANQMRIPIGGIKSFSFDFPPLKTQRKIANILSAYDDLIENNLKRIKLLEEKARLIYEEWFVRLKFPGHETVVIDADTGLPEGWEKVTCYDAMKVLSGGTPKTTTNEYWNGTIEFFTPKDAMDGVYTNGTEKHITELGLTKCNSKLYPKNTVFITARGTVGKVNLSAKPMAMNQSCYALIGTGSLNQIFLYNAIKCTIQSFKGAANGGVFDTIVVDTFKFLPFTIPSAELVSKYSEATEPLFQTALILQNQNQLLKEARDILLPRLMTGMIDVDNLKV